MLILNLIKKNKRFVLSQVPQLIILIFLLFLVLIVGASNQDRLLVFASETGESDITGSITITLNEQISALNQWESNLLENNQTTIQVFQSGVMVPIKHLNSSLLLNTTNISSSVKLIFTDNIFNISLNDAYIYGPIFRSNNISEGMKLNISTSYSFDEDFYSSNVMVNISEEVFEVPNFILGAYFWEDSANFIFLNYGILSNYMSSIPLTEIEFTIPYLFSCLFTTEFKNTFKIRQELNSFLFSSQKYLNTTFINENLEPVIINWDTSSILKRIEDLAIIVREDLTFFGLITLPLFLLLIVVIYQSKDLIFNYFKNIIMHFDKKGFSQNKINQLFVKIFFVFNFSLVLLGSVLILAITFIFSFDSLRITVLSSILLSVWVTISILFQTISFRTELKKHYNESFNPLDSLTHRKQWKHDLISFAFKGAIFCTLCLALYFLHLIYSFNYLAVVVIYIVCILSALFLFHSSLESLLRHFVTILSSFLVMVIGRRIFKGTESIIQKLFGGKKNMKSFEYTSLLILFLLSPSVLIVSDSYNYNILNQHYNLFCGDIVIENITNEVLTYLHDNFSPDQLLPIIEWNTTEGITFFFSNPIQYAEFAEHTLEKGEPFTEGDGKHLLDLRNLNANQSEVLVSKELSDARNISLTDTVVFQPPLDEEFLTFPANITQINYTVSSIVDFLPYISSKCDNWVFGVLEVNQTETIPHLLKKEVETTATYIFNQSLITTVCIRLNETESPVQIETDLKNSYSFLNIIHLEDREDINDKYPVPYERFQQLIVLELIIAFLLLQLFYLQLINSLYHKKKLSILQLFTRGISRKFLFLGFGLSLSANVIVISALSIPFIYLLSLGILKIITIAGITNVVPIVFSHHSILIYVGSILLLISIDVVIVYKKLHTTLKNIENI